MERNRKHEKIITLIFCIARSYNFQQINMKLLTILFLCVSMSAYAQVRTDLAGDTLKGNVKKMTEYVYEVYGTCCNSAPMKRDTMKRVYICDTADATETINLYNDLDMVTAKVLMKFDNNGHLIEKGFYTDIDSLYMRHTYTYDAHGHNIEEREARYPFHASSSVQYSDEFMEVKDSDGYCIKYKYAQGYMVEMTSESFWGTNITPNETADYKYDSRGNKIEEDDLKIYQRDHYVTFYIDGKEYTTKTIYKYDDRNRLIESTEYFEGKPNPNADLAAPKRHSGTIIGGKDLYTYNGQSNKADSVTLIWMYREDDGSITNGEPESKPIPKSKETKEYDKQGNVVKKMNGAVVTLEREIEYF